MKKIIFLAVSLVLTLNSAFGQQARGVCGNSTEDQLEFQDRLLQHIATLENGIQATDRDVIQYVPVHFHFVGDASGNGKHLERKVLDQLCDLNEAYAPMDIRFYLSPHPTYGLFDRSINNNNVYNNQSNDFLMSARRHPNAINVYVVEEPVPGTAQPGTILAYYSGNNDWIVSRKTETQGGHNGTMPHEMGHLFSLSHTFFGWESGTFKPGSVGWPVAPVISPGGIPTERQNGTNCTTAGDYICDTPPDYNFGYEQGNCNPYTLGAKDPQSTLVDPQETNFMSYFSDCGTNYLFTSQQQAIILSDLASPQRNYLDNTFSPAALTINTPTNLLIAPIGGPVIQYYDEVLLEWQAVPGATYYLVEVDQSAGFGSPILKNYIATGTSKLVTDLLPNKNYNWRIRPFNEYVTCAQARASSFKTSLISATRELQNLNAWQVSPNPVLGNTSVRLTVEASDHFEASARIVNAAGQQVYQQNDLSFPSGESVVELPVEGLANGIYFILLENQNGREVRKLAVLR